MTDLKGVSDSINNNKPTICFVSLGSYSLLTGQNIQSVGGAEIQQVKLSKVLKEIGYEIIFIVYAEKNCNTHFLDGIKIFKAYDINDVKNYNIIKKIILLYKKMKKADSDIYFYRSGCPGITAIYCKLNNKKSIKSIASDTEVIGKSFIKKTGLITLLSKFANWLDMKLSDVIIAQSEFQKAELKKRFNRDSIVIRNSLDPSIDKKHDGLYILWIGTIRDVKQPEIFLKIAKNFPKHKFVMIGGLGESPELLKKIKKESASITNLDFKGFMPHFDILKYYQEAVLLINTSKIEGFSNTFLEAWSCSIPVVSLNVDPDGIISKYNLGFHSKNFQQMLIDIEKLLNDKKLLKKMGDNGKKYVELNHNIIKIVYQYEELFKYLINDY